jgi:hypothetical protein
MEMDVWEANSWATAFTPHPCTVNQQYRCERDCGSNTDRYNGVCDKDGCDFNSYRMGDKEFIGRGKAVDTTKKITVVTQFITADGTANGALSEIRRIYVQNGRVSIPIGFFSYGRTNVLCSYFRSSKTRFQRFQMFPATRSQTGSAQPKRTHLATTMISRGREV